MQRSGKTGPAATGMESERQSDGERNAIPISADPRRGRRVYRHFARDRNPGPDNVQTSQTCRNEWFHSHDSQLERTGELRARIDESKRGKTDSRSNGHSPRAAEIY